MPYFIYNSRSFIAPHLATTLSLQNERKENDRSVCRREEMGFVLFCFVFWLKRGEWRRMPDTERKRVPDHRTDVLKWSLPQGPHALPRNTEYLSIRFSATRARRRDEATQKRMEAVAVPGICESIREPFCIESGSWLVASADRRVNVFIPAVAIWWENTK